MNTRLPSTISLRTELIGANPPAGHYDQSVVQFGCEGCPNAKRSVGGWLSVVKLIELMDAEENQSLPRAFVAGNFSSVGKAEPCPITVETSEPNCQYEDTLRTVVSRITPKPTE